MISLNNDNKYTHAFNSEKTNQCRLNLFSFPYAGGGINAYRDWVEDLPKWCNLSTIILPGREKFMHDEPFTNLKEAANILADTMASQLNMPYIFFGHSLGAYLLYEVIQILRARGLPLPLEIWVSGQRAPDIPDPDPPIYNLPYKEFISEIQKYDGTPDEILKDEEIMKFILPKLRADFSLIDTYEYKSSKPLNIPIIAFGGMQDKEVSIEEIKGWQYHTTKEFKLNSYNGDHFFIHSAKDEIFHDFYDRFNLIASSLGK